MNIESIILTFPEIFQWRKLSEIFKPGPILKKNGRLAHMPCEVRTWTTGIPKRILLQMSLFDRKVLQIGVANITLLQKYCILNIGNTLAWKVWAICWQCLRRRLWLQTEPSWLQLVQQSHKMHNVHMPGVYIAFANISYSPYCNRYNHLENAKCNWSHK